ncbi:MAG: signal peptidase I [Verrucomicrobiae bacterium]|jgi:signal peptidase I|nr:signal peptidase I [Verrucomicrobiae bacterium]
MFFFTPRYLKAARELRAAAQKLFHYHCDLWSREQSDEARHALQALETALKIKKAEPLALAQEKVETLFSSLVPARRHHVLAENVESIVIAIVLAVGFQAYLLKPFRIPTGSMQPTLYGMTGHPEATLPPSPLARAFDFVRLGRSYISVQAKQEEEILSLEEKTFLNFFTFTKVTTSLGSYSLFAPRDVLIRDFKVRPGRILSPGEIIAQGYVQAGDQIFVDRMSYAFCNPKAADVFVFITSGIAGIEMRLDPALGSQYYVKRLAGLAGQTLRIDPPRLFIDGSTPHQAGFLKVISAIHGYRGYSNGTASGDSSPYLGSPEETFTVPSESFFALGDNSYNSSDSRYWGVVPEHNVIGRAFFVYWPFSSRWGLIH